MLINYVKNLIKDKNICILGFGREGKSTYSLFTKAGGFKSITICDQNPVNCETAIVVSGESYQKDLDRFDIIMKSPGIVLEEGALKDFSRLYSQTEIFLSVYKNQTIGITGTKGKSTTTCLIHHVLNACGKKAVLLGNIGIPAFDGEVGCDDIVVFELSSHQLEYTSVSPKTAIFLNIFPEHLDHYGTFDKYFDAKKNIYRNQSEGDWLICGEDVIPNGDCKADITVFGKDCDIKILPDSFVSEGEKIVPGDASPLLGSHNINNIAVAYTVAKSFGISADAFLSALYTFKPLPHRLERLGEKDGITFYDDSISTCSQTTIQALLSLKGVGSVLIGGMDRGIDYTPLEEFLTTHPIPHVIFMYDTGMRILAELEGKPHIAQFHYAKDLAQAVNTAKSVTEKNSICLLSPAAASYGFFKNFEDRGDKFKELVL